MYIHIGNDDIVLTSEIIMILDKKILESSQDIHFLLSKVPDAERKKSTCKSIVVTKDRIFLSPLSSSTLKKRLEIY